MNPGGYSYFFCHSAFPYSVASFLGAIGSIQDFTIAKGSITTSTGTSPYSFHYNIREVDVSNFIPITTLGDSTTVSWIQPSGSPILAGEAKFILGFVTK